MADGKRLSEILRDADLLGFATGGEEPAAGDDRGHFGEDAGAESKAASRRNVTAKVGKPVTQ